MTRVAYASRRRSPVAKTSNQPLFTAPVAFRAEENRLMTTFLHFTAFPVYSVHKAAHNCREASGRVGVRPR